MEVHEIKAMSLVNNFLHELMKDSDEGKDRLRFTRHAVQAYDQFQRRLKRGVTTLVSHPKLQGYFPDAGKLYQLLESEEELIQPGEQTLQQIMGFTNEQILAFYEHGSELYREENYIQASDVFMFLATLCPKAQGFWVMLAQSETARHDDPSALLAYVGALSASDDLTPSLGCAQCLARLGCYHEAINLLNGAIEQAQERHLSGSFVEKARKLRETI